MTCPNCGAGVSRAMVSAGECAFCHTALKRDVPNREVVHVTHVKVHAPRPTPSPQVVLTEVAPVDPVTSRVFGCFSGCASAAVSVAVTGFILVVVAYQIWAHTPVSAPSPPDPVPISRPDPPPRPLPGRRRR